MTVALMAVIVAGLAWMYPTRAIRAQTLSLRELPYVDVARLNGIGGLRMVFTELLPNLAPYFAASFVTAVVERDAGDGRAGGARARAAEPAHAWHDAVLGAVSTARCCAACGGGGCRRLPRSR